MKRGLNRTFSALLTMFVIGMLLMAGPASAVSVNISNVSNTTPTPGESVTFTAEVEVNVDENIPINQIELQINTGANEYHCYYRVDGSFVDSDPSTPASFCTDFTLTRDTSIDSYGYSDNRYGFGYSIDGPANISYGPGYGYGYGTEFGYGYGYGYGTPVSLRYSVVWDTTDASGIYDVRFQATAMDSDGEPIFTYTSDPQRFTVSTPVVDNAAPIISIIGNNPAFVTVNTTYTDAGATAHDAVEGAVPVTSNGSVDTGTIGTYFITYTACDSSMNCASATRTVFVIAEQPPSTSPVWVGGNVVNTFGTGADIDVYSNQLVDFELRWGTSPDNLDSRTEAWDADWARIRIEGLAPLTRYYYQVRGCNQFGSCDSNEIATFTSSVPNINTDVHSITDHSASFTSSSDVVVDFTLHYGIGLPSEAVTMTIDALTSEYTLTGLEEGTTYTYYVSGCMGDICGSTAWENFTTLNIPPTITHAASTGLGVVILEGTTDEPATIMVTLGTDTRLVAGTSFDEEFSGLAHDTTYGYTIQACDAKANCNTVSGTVTTPPPPDVAPAISASVSPSTTTADVTASSNEEVQFTITLGNTTYDAGSGTSMQFTLQDLSPSTAYAITIHGCNSLCGNTTLDFVTSEEFAQESAPTSSGGNGGGGGGTCATGFTRQNGQCVRIENTNTGGSGGSNTDGGTSGDANDEIPVISVDVPALPEEPADEPFTPADVGDGNLVTGLVTDESAGAGSSTWLWFSALAGAIILGLVGYFVLRKH